MSAGPDRPFRVVVLVSGNGSNLQAIVDAAHRGELPIELAAVVSDRPGVFALERARRAGIPDHTIDYRSVGDRDRFGAELGARLDALRPALVVLAGFMRILPSTLVERYQGRMINVHPSLLPKYPGLDTYARALAAGDEWHGSTVHFVTPELDAGPALLQYRVRVRPGDTENSLRERVQAGEHVIFPRAVGWLATGRAMHRDGQAWLDGRPLTGPEVVLESPAG